MSNTFNIIRWLFIFGLLFLIGGALIAYTSWPELVTPADPGPPGGFAIDAEYSGSRVGVILGALIWGWGCIMSAIAVIATGVALGTATVLHRVERV